MAQILSKILDAILANVELTIVVSIVNISKTAGGSPGSFRRLKAYILFLMASKN
jgi:hypothetical protein